MPATITSPSLYRFGDLVTGRVQSPSKNTKKGKEKEENKQSDLSICPNQRWEGGGNQYLRERRPCLGAGGKRRSKTWAGSPRR